MSKKILLILVVFLGVITAGYWMYHKTQIPPQQAANKSEASVQVSIHDIFGGEKLQYFSEDTPLIFKNTSAGVTVSLKGSSYKGNKGPNIVSLGQENIGQVEGAGLLSPSFSPDNKYFAFREVDALGTSFDSFNISFVDLINKKVLFVNPPKKFKDYPFKSNYIGYDIFPFIESYSWDGADDIQLVFYFVGTDESNNESYRISQREVWGYNLPTSKYSLIKTLPE